MSFFDVPRPAPVPRVEVEAPVWAGPPRGVLPGVSPQHVIVFKTERAFLMAHRFLSFPNGLQFTFNLRLRYPDDYQLDRPWLLHERSGSGVDADDQLRVGLLLSDGTKWTSLDSDWRPRQPHEQPERPFVMGLGGGGGDGSFNMRYWMWPLPPDGPMTVVSEWPAFDIEETRAVVDATELRARAAEANAIWPE